MIEAWRGESSRRKLGFVPPRRRAHGLPEDAMDVHGPVQAAIPAPAPEGVPGPPAPRFRRNGHGLLFYNGPCPSCRVRGSLYYRVRSDTWRCMGCTHFFREAMATRGEFREVLEIVQDLGAAVKLASDRAHGDDFRGATEALWAVVTWSRQALELIERQRHAIAEDRARAGR